MQYLRENTATRITIGPFYDVTDGVTPEIALTVTNCLLTFVVDDAGVPTLVLNVAPTASGGANDMVHITSDAAGYYDLELAAANVNYTGRAKLSIHDTDVHLPVFHEFQIISANVYDALFADGDLLDVSVTEWLGTACETPTTAGRPNMNVKSISDSTGASDAMKEGAESIISGTTGSGSTSTNIVSGLTTSIDQFNGKVINFKSDTTTTALQGLSTKITDTDASGNLTVVAIPAGDLPVNTDTFTIT